MGKKEDEAVIHNLDSILDSYREKVVPTEEIVSKLANQWSKLSEPYEFILYVMEASHNLQYGWFPPIWIFDLLWKLTKFIRWQNI